MRLRGRATGRGVDGATDLHNDDGRCLERRDDPNDEDGPPAVAQSAEGAGLHRVDYYTKFLGPVGSGLGLGRDCDESFTRKRVRFDKIFNKYFLNW